jgi:hypothetical protein
MRSSVIWSFLSLVALATSGLVTGCDSDATITKSGEGESCDSSADCTDGYKCFQGACYKSAGPDTGEGGADDPGVGPTPPVLGGEGESCTRAADCEEGLGCYNNRCVTDPTGAGGASSDPVRLGLVNEACQVTSDCSAGLACRVVPTVSALVSVCTPAGGQIDATGKSCNGAECTEAADCCQLPTQLFAATAAKSCTELAALVADADCDAPTGNQPAQCFAYTAYCECDDTWSCSEAGQCVYEAECTEDVADSPGGCPTYSRSGHALVAVGICNEDGVCAAEVPTTTGCTTDASCAGKVVADDPADECVGDECTCVKELKKCYRKCNGDLDCSAGTPAVVDDPLTVPDETMPATPRRVCDMDQAVCVLADLCTTNESCVRRLGDIDAVCLEGTCRASCSDDHDCNPGGIAAAYTAVCNDNKICEPLGCEEDTECPGTPSGVKLFCTAPHVGAAGTNVASAITD